MWQVLKDSWIMLGALVGITAAAVVFLYVPQGEKLDELRAAMTVQELELSGDAARAAVVPTLLSRVESMKLRYKDFDRRLPKRKELGGFLRDISGRLKQGDLSNQLIEPGNPSREELFHTLPIIMRFKGAYLSLAAFLQRINQMERVTRVHTLKIKRAEDGDDLDIELQMNIYFTES